MKKITTFAALGLVGLLAGCSKQIEGIVTSEARSDNESDYQYAWSIVVSGREDGKNKDFVYCYSSTGTKSLRNSGETSNEMERYIGIKAVDKNIDIGDRVVICTDWRGIDYLPQKMMKK